MLPDKCTSTFSSNSCILCFDSIPRLAVGKVYTRIVQLLHVLWCGVLASTQADDKEPLSPLGAHLLFL